MEEAPIPAKLTQEENDFTIISNKNNFFSISVIKFIKTIKIIAKFKDELLTHVYKIELSLEEFYKKNKFFKIFETIDEIYKELILFMNNNQKAFLLEENESIKIIILLEIININEISFILTEEKKTDKDLIKELFNLVKELKGEISELKKENKQLKSKINIFESYIPLLEKYKNNKQEIQFLNSLLINDDIKSKKK